MSSSFDPRRLNSALDVERAAETIFGDPLQVRPPLGHVAAVWSPGDGRNLVMKIDGRTPKSAVDRFALNCSRATAHAIVTTGAILRSEPELGFGPFGPEATAMERWRREVHGLGAPLALVLSRGRDLDASHPVFSSPVKIVLFVPHDRAADLESGFDGHASVEVVGDLRPDVRGAVRWLRARHDRISISIEAGPATANSLYFDPPLVDELLLSRYRGQDIDADSVAGSALDDAALQRTHVRMHRYDEGEWSFERWTLGERR